MQKTPLLVLAYNRPDMIRRLVDSLRAVRAPSLMIAVDGPKPGNPADAAKVAAVQDIVASIDWTDDVVTRFRPVNLGLRTAVADAVTWAVMTHGRAMVIEDDAIPGPDFIPYVSTMLERYRDDDSIAHVSGYNLVPPKISGETGSRLTLYPESFAWGTWERAWTHYDPSMQWARNVSIAELASITGDRVSALRWRQQFSDAAAERVSTWAYRWIASMWSRRALTLSPNRNLVKYIGYEDGTHTTLQAPWEELPVFDGDVACLLQGPVARNLASDAWVGRQVFNETPFGLARGVVISAALEARKAMRRRRR